MAAWPMQGTIIPKPGTGIKGKGLLPQNFFGYLTRFSYIHQRAAEKRS
jgi:hypothetical protein